MTFDKLTPAQLKNRLRRINLCGLALDIDDTLAYTDHHWIEEMRIKFGNPENLTRDEIVARYQFIDSVPYWQSKKAQATMRRFMHSNRFQETIPLIEDASHTVEKINKIIPIVAYITARPNVVFPGTRKWLSKHGFPKAPIVLKPMGLGITKKNSWKARVLLSLYPFVTGIIDDNPGLIKELAALKYKGDLYVYDSGKNLKTYKNTVRAKGWKELLTAVKQRVAARAREAHALSTKKPKGVKRR